MVQTLDLESDPDGYCGRCKGLKLANLTTLAVYNSRLSMSGLSEYTFRDSNLEQRGCIILICRIHAIHNQ